VIEVAVHADGPKETVCESARWNGGQSKPLGDDAVDGRVVSAAFGFPSVASLPYDDHVFVLNSLKIFAGNTGARLQKAAATNSINHFESFSSADRHAWRRARRLRAFVNNAFKKAGVIAPLLAGPRLLPRGRWIELRFFGRSRAG